MSLDDRGQNGNLVHDVRLQFMGDLPTAILMSKELPSWASCLTCYKADWYGEQEKQLKR